MPHIRELIHQHVCADVNHAFRQLKKDIDEVWQNLTHQVGQQIPAFPPNPIQQTIYGDAVQLNNGEWWYSK